MPRKRKEPEEPLQSPESGSNVASIIHSKPKNKKQKLEDMQEVNLNPSNHAANGSARKPVSVLHADSAPHLGNDIDANNITGGSSRQADQPDTPHGNGAATDWLLRDNAGVPDAGEIIVNHRGMAPHTSQAKRKRRKRKSDGTAVSVVSPEHEEGAMNSTSVSKQPREISKRAWKRNKRAARAAAEEKATTISGVAEVKDETLSAIETTSQTFHPEPDPLTKTVTNLAAVAPKRKHRKHARNKQKGSGVDDVKLDHGNKVQDSLADIDAGAGRSRRKARTGVTTEAVSAPDHISTITTTPRNIEKSDAALQTRNVDGKQTWNLSEPSAGSFLDMHPIFSQDGQHIMIATSTTVLIYSTQNSLLVHTLRHGEHTEISSYFLSPSDPTRLYTTSRSGSIVAWNWPIEQQTAIWETGAPCLGAAVALSADGTDVLFTIDGLRKSAITARELGSDANEISSKIILNHDARITSVQVTADAMYVVGMTQLGLVVGRSSNPARKAYKWLDFRTGEPPACMALQAVQKLVESTESRVPKQKDVIINVAVGGVKGCIYTYENLAESLSLSGKSSKSIADGVVPSVREMHWHREAVGTVAWSLDGNYLISGGRETVLVLWQLETARKQFLPNLESPIRNLTVSPSGSSYAVDLADNSVMIISTSELRPTANVAGIQSSTHTDLDTKLHSGVMTVESITPPERLHEHFALPAVLHPLTPNLLLTAVPALQKSTSMTQSPSPYLQTFDVHTSRHIARQALTRTNATTTTLSPEGTPIQAPNITHLALTPNGRWLVTAEEWTPPRCDFEDLIVDDEDRATEVARHTEVQLKFWSWEATDATWALNSRVEAPHQFQDSRASGRVLAMAVDPATTAVATHGEDSTVRLWAPRTRIADGRVLRGDRAETTDTAGQTWWSVSASIALERAMRDDPLSTLTPSRGLLAYSDDGSALAAYQHFGDAVDAASTPVHFLDAEASVVRTSRTGLLHDPNAHDGVRALAFLERHLVLVGRGAFAVWDVTSTTLLAAGALALPPYLHSLPPPLLAVDVATNTFAIACATARTAAADDRREKIRPRDMAATLRVFAPTSADPIATIALPRPLRALLPASGVQRPPRRLGVHRADAAASTPEPTRRGYVLIDDAACTRTLEPASRTAAHNAVDDALADGNTTAALEAPAVDPANESSASVSASASDDDDDDDVDMDRTEEPSTSSQPPPPQQQQDYRRAVPGERRVVRPEQLARLFDYPTYALPSMRELCAGVFGLYAGTARGVEA